MLQSSAAVLLSFDDRFFVGTEGALGCGMAGWTVEKRPTQASVMTSVAATMAQV